MVPGMVSGWGIENGWAGLVQFWDKYRIGYMDLYMAGDRKIMGLRRIQRQSTFMIPNWNVLTAGHKI
jgi:hypothetical protein